MDGQHFGTGLPTFHKLVFRFLPKKNVSLVPLRLRLFDDDDLNPEQSKTVDYHLPLLEYDNAAVSLFDGNWPY